MKTSATGDIMDQRQDSYWGDPSGNIRRMEGEQEIIATVVPACSEKERLAMLDALNAQREPAKPTMVTITVNGQEHHVADDEISYEDVVRHAFPVRPGTFLTVTYRGGGASRPAGEILPLQRVPVRAGMVFNVADTSRA